jgi:hypothetical protein
MVLEQGRDLQDYDLVVLDESESLLHHCTAETLKGKQREVFRTFLDVLRGSRGVLAMDAFLGDETREFLEMVLGSAPPVVCNNHRGRSKRFIFISSIKAWQLKIVHALKRGENVVVPCMASDMAKNLEGIIKAACPELPQDAVLVIYSKAGDEVSAQMQTASRHGCAMP